jgi:hypothetical protein
MKPDDSKKQTNRNCHGPNESCLWRKLLQNTHTLITQAARPKAWTCFVPKTLGFGFEFRLWHGCLCLFCVRVVLCIDRGLATGWSPSKESYRVCIGLRNWKNRYASNKGLQSHDDNNNDNYKIYKMTVFWCMMTLVPTIRKNILPHSSGYKFHFMIMEATDAS